MAIRIRTTQNSLSGLIAAWVCLCAFTLTSFSPFAMSATVEFAEGESPCEEGDGENAEEALEALSSARRSLNRRQHRVVFWAYRSGKHPDQTVSQACYRPAIIGHQLTNGLCAPLLV